jgi:predicted aminopeptidase
MISVAVYHDYVPAFSELLRRHGNELKPFYAACRQMAELPKTERHQRLKALMPGDEYLAQLKTRMD